LSDVCPVCPVCPACSVCSVCSVRDPTCPVVVCPVRWVWLICERTTHKRVQRE
jgi:hypothetical protein